MVVLPLVGKHRVNINDSVRGKWVQTGYLKTGGPPQNRKKFSLCIKPLSKSVGR